jgi:hypothetical protein
MSNVLRSTTFQLEFNGNDGITGVKTFSKAIRDADGLVDELNNTLGENATVTAKNVKTKQELAREARAVATQFARNEKRTERLTQQFKFMSSIVGKTADEVQILNAVQQLGANATKQQQEQVANSVRSYQQLRNAQEKQQGSLRNSRGVMQNFGWQLQDTVVQLQMGTSAFTVLSQQGSQMASAFGPGGAILGAVIALAGVVGGTLFTSLQSATQQTKKLEEATVDIAKVLTSTSSDVFKLTEELERLYKIDRELAELRVKAALMDASTQMKEAGKNIVASFDEIGVAWYNLTVNDLIAGGKGLDYLRNFTTQITGIKDSSKSFDDAKFRVRGLLAAIEQLEKQGANTASINRFGDSLENVSGVVSKNNDKFNSFIKNSLDLVVQFRNGELSAKNLKTALDDLNKSITNRGSGSDDIVKAFEQEVQRTKRQTETIQEEYNRRIKIIQDFYLSGKKSDEDATAAAIRLLEWKTSEEEKLRKKTYDKRWSATVKAFEQEYNRTTKQTETIQQEYERRYSVIKAITEKPDYDAEKAAQAYANLEMWKTNALRVEYQKRERIRQRIENAQIQTRGGNDPTGSENALFIRNMKTLAEQAAQIDEDKFEEKKRINALIEGEVNRHVTAMASAEIQTVQNQVAIFSMASSQLSNLANIMSNGTADIENQVAEMNSFQKAMFIVSQTVAAAQALINGMSLGVQLASMFPLIAPQMVAFGTGLGSATAGAIAGVTVAGAFDNGGYIPSGQIGAVAGYGDEFVNGTLIQGPANVTSRKDTAELLRDGAGQGGSRVSLKVDIENRIEGAKYQVEQLSEDRVRIIARQEFSRNIDEGVSNTLSNNNSKSAKSLRKNYQVNRKL